MSGVSRNEREAERWRSVEHLPDNATLEDAIERRCFLAKVEEGVRQSNAGETVPHPDAVRQL